LLCCLANDMATVTATHAPCYLLATTATPAIYPLSLHDALPIYQAVPGQPGELELGALGFRLPRIAHILGGGIDRRIPLVDEALQILLPGVEESGVEAQAIVEQVGLEAHLDVHHILGAEGRGHGGAHVPAAGHGGAAGLGVEEEG